MVEMIYHELMANVFPYCQTAPIDSIISLLAQVLIATIFTLSALVY